MLTIGLKQNRRGGSRGRGGCGGGDGGSVRANEPVKGQGGLPPTHRD